MLIDLCFLNFHNPSPIRLLADLNHHELGLNLEYKASLLRTDRWVAVLYFVPFRGHLALKTN